MGEQSDLIINGDVCEGCGENFDDEGDGYPRRCSSCKGMPKIAINTIKSDRIKKSSQILKSEGLKWEEFNNGYHWRINKVDYWPTRDKWKNPLTGEIQFGIRDLIQFLKPKQLKINQLSVDQIFDIAKGSKDKSLFGICEAIHRGIYQ